MIRPSCTGKSTRITSGLTVACVRRLSNPIERTISDSQCMTETEKAQQSWRRYVSRYGIQRSGAVASVTVAECIHEGLSAIPDELEDDPEHAAIVFPSDLGDRGFRAKALALIVHAERRIWRPTEKELANANIVE